MLVLKRIVSSLLMLIMIVGQIVPINVNATERKSECSVKVMNKEVYNLENNFDEDSILCEKLLYDVNNNTTELSDKLEQSLNEAGVFDSEINGLDEQSLKCLEKSINLQVYVEYSEINNQTGEVTEMKNEEIDEVIEEEIEKGNIEYEEESYTKKLLKMIGVIPEEVKGADVYYSDKKNGISSSGALKQVIYACQYKKGGPIYVMACATWVKEAYYRNKDIFAVSISNGNIVNDSWSCSHTATYHMYYGGKWSKKYYNTNPKKRWTAWAGSGIIYMVNLFGTRKGLTALPSSGKGPYFSDEQIIVKFKCKVKNKGTKTVSFSPHYYHMQTSKSYTPSVSIGEGGFSIGISGSSKNYYSEITGNPILHYKYK